MSQVVTLFKNISWVTISQVVSNICAFIWTILIARYLGVTDYGILSFVISFVMILGIAIGTYSSIFFCTVLVDIWDEKKYASIGASKKA